MIFRTILQLIYAGYDKKCTIKKKRRLKMDDMACMKFRYLYLERRGCRKTTPVFLDYRNGA